MRGNATVRLVILPESKVVPGDKLAISSKNLVNSLRKLFDSFKIKMGPIFIPNTGRISSGRKIFEIRLPIGRFVVVAL